MIDILKLANNDLPVFREERYQDWIKYGSDNRFPDKLIDLVGKSALHGAIVSSKVSATKGLGLEYEGEPDPKTDAFLKEANDNETLNEVFAKATFDLVLFGGYALEVILSKDKKSIAQVNHIDFSKLRCTKSDADNNINDYLYSKDWSRARQSEYAPKSIPAYTIGSKEPRQLIYFKDYRPGLEYYPLPAYIGALSYIETDVEIANFHLSNIKNGMAPSVMINFPNGVPNEEERKIHKRDFERQFTGSDKAGKVIISYSDDKDRAPIVNPISVSQLDKQFNLLQTQVLDNILAGHKIVSPLLVGLRGGGGLGSNASEIESAFELYNNQVINPLKEQLLKSFNKIMIINGMQELDVISTAPISFTFSEDILLQILSTDEMRAKIGYEPLNKPIA